MITVPARALTFLVAVACAGLLLALPGPAAADAGQTTCDFDGDGRNDLAVGVPGEDYGKGAVNLQYHDDGYLNDPQVLHFGWMIARTGFGTALACGDFDDGDVDDLAVGAPGDLEGGSVFVFYGNAERGLSPNDFQKFSQAHRGIPGHTRRQEDFGYALAVGDFNADDYEDLAIGDPRELDTDYLDGDEAGTVIIVRGSSSGLDLNGDVQKISGSARHSHNERRYQRFGASLAAAPLVSGAGDDLVVGAPQTHADGTYAGRTYLFRSEAHLVQSQMVDQTDFPFATGLSPAARFGHALATGDFDDDGHNDVAIGAPYDKVNQAKEGGMVLVLGGHGNGFDPTDSKRVKSLRQETVGGVTEIDDKYGWSLAAGDWNLDGHDDLAVGAPSEDIDSTTNAGVVLVNAGAVFVHYGNDFLISPQGRILHQGKATTPDHAHGHDWFGAGLASISLLTGKNDDLVIGVPGESFLTQDPDCGAHAGALHIAFGWLDFGPATNSDFMLHQNTGAPYHVADQRECSPVWAPAPIEIGDDVKTGKDLTPHGEFFGWAVAF